MQILCAIQLRPLKSKEFPSGSMFSFNLFFCSMYFREIDRMVLKSGRYKSLTVLGIKMHRTNFNFVKVQSARLVFSP